MMPISPRTSTTPAKGALSPHATTRPAEEISAQDECTFPLPRRDQSTQNAPKAHIHRRNLSPSDSTRKASSKSAGHLLRMSNDSAIKKRWSKQPKSTIETFAGPQDTLVLLPSPSSLLLKEQQYNETMPAASAESSTPHIFYGDPKQVRYGSLYQHRGHAYDKAVQSSPSASLRNKPNNRPRSIDTTWDRPQSSHQAPQSKSTKSLAGAHAADPRKMLQLMRKTRGRIRGQILYSTGGSSNWYLGYGSIDADSAALDELDAATGRYVRCFMPDLQECRTRAVLQLDGTTVILGIQSQRTGENFHFRPMDEALLNAWFAALLCWQSIDHFKQEPEKPEGLETLQVQNMDHEPSVRPGGKPEDVIKVTKANFLEIEDRGITTGNGMSGNRTKWHTVSCILRANGEFRIQATTDGANLAYVHLAELPRSALQTLSSSVVGVDRIIVILPQYARSIDACSQLRPVYISFDSLEMYEVWYVLLQIYAQPELCGSWRLKSGPSGLDGFGLPGLDPLEGPGLFRIYNSFHIRINYAKLWTSQCAALYSLLQQHSQSKSALFFQSAQLSVEILLDGQIKAKASLRPYADEPSWYESFDIEEPTTAYDTLCVRVKMHSPDGPLREHLPQSIPSSPSSDSAFQSVQVTCLIIAQTLVNIKDIPIGDDWETWWPLESEASVKVGEIYLKAAREQHIVLLDQEYNALSQLILDYSNLLTLHILQRLPSELSRISEILLNIFQVSGIASEWIIFLAEEEIDGGIPTGSVTDTVRWARRVGSNESRDSRGSAPLQSGNGSREEVVRDLKKSYAAEANLLFRGNTLLSKTMDLHMRRLGQEFLIETIGPHIRDLETSNADYEVNPAKITNNQTLQKNWRQLIRLTENIWESIYHSASKCPQELRVIFRYIRAFADDRYGDHMRTVRYSSVSSFLFLRFFCAAILNPRLFGIIQVYPHAHTQAARTLVAKSLQTLANLTTFGAKEHWMTPMNDFILAHRDEFKDFIETVCAVPTAIENPMPPSYRTPLTIYERLHHFSREGVPSLPFLIDRARSFAGLVDLWLDALAKSTTTSESSSPAPRPSSPLARFHDICLSLRMRTRVAFRSADRSVNVSHPKHVAMAQLMESAPFEFWVKDQADPIPVRKRSLSHPVAVWGTNETTAPHPDQGVQSDTESENGKDDRSRRFWRRKRVTKRLTG